MEDHDFSGYATVANRKCSDGLTIMPQAFAHMHNQKVPLVFQHVHTDQKQVVGHVILEQRDAGDKKGVYAHGYLNDTDAGKNMKLLIQHKDLDSLSIFANNVVVKEKNKVVHGNIREVSVVLSGANPEAKIDFVRIKHSSDPGDFTELDDEAVMVFGEKLDFVHADGDTDVIEHKTMQEVFDTLNEEQTEMVLVLVDQARKGANVEQSGMGDDADDQSDDNDQDQSGGTDLAHKEGQMTRKNVFEENGKEIKHSDGGGGYKGSGLSTEQITTLLHSAQQMKSLKDAIIAHADDYGITNIEVLFPDAQMIDSRPEWITRRIEWVEGVLNGTQKLPFSKIKSRHADLTHAEARAKGYIKATMKKEQFFSISQRETTPKTIYKKQKLDRDDIIDITDFDIVAWLWVEMRFMLREEVARAILVSDGREVDDPEKINENNIRPIAYDDEFYTDVVSLPGGTTSLQLVDAVIANRYKYKGTGPTAYMSVQEMTALLLVRDGDNKRMYRTKADLAAELLVRDIVEVEVMENVKRDGKDLVMILVNLADYAVGSTKGGEITTFEDFDIDWNQYKYLIETRLSGALTRYKTAQVILRGTATLATPTVPTFNTSTGVLTVPSVTGVVYRNVTNPASPVTLSSGAQTAIASGATIEVDAIPASGYYFPHGFDDDWSFKRD